jgi:hypothetical protein
MPTDPPPDPQPPKTASPTDALPEAIRQHHQDDNASCAVSGQECIAKLHGFIAPDAFPLQSDPANKKRGFGVNDRAFLKTHKIDAKDDFYDASSSVALIEAETKAGRYPLVSLIGKDPDGNWGYHTYLCAQHEGELLLVDPAKPTILVKGVPTLRAVLDANGATNPFRKTIHILSYTLPVSSDETESSTA